MDIDVVTGFGWPNIEVMSIGWRIEFDWLNVGMMSIDFVLQFYQPNRLHFYQPICFNLLSHLQPLISPTPAP
jgi:hypothetical protein